jgi:beta-phosphoglucomutase-like phosphatase (HAD superfamily)
MSLRGRRRSDNVDQVRAWIGEAGQAVPTAAELLAVQQPIAQRLLRGAAPMPGARGLLEHLRDLQVAMALVTSSGRDAVERKCAPHPWLGIIRERVLGDDPELRVGKPAPDPFLLAAQRLGVAPGDCWAFEDSLAGAQSARAAGCVVHVVPGTELSTTDLSELQNSADHLLGSLADLRLD